MEKDDYNMSMPNDYVKQIIVVRKDLNMRKGKLAAQVAHASMKVVLDEMQQFGFSWELDMYNKEQLHEWLDGSFTKVVVSCKDEKELLELKEKADNAGILCALITDAGKTEFHGKPTNTCIAIGPEWASKLEPITGHLSLL